MSEIIGKPTRCLKDSKGCFCRWGSSGAKYYYTCGDKAARNRARAKADKQGRAARAGGYKGSENNIAKVISKPKEINAARLRKKLLEAAKFL